MAYTPGYFMPNNWYGPAYPQMNQSAAMNPVSQGNDIGIHWVDGEVEAKAFQIPPGFPAGKQIALWDVNDQVIYVKSLNQMGMPNPMWKVRYTMEEEKKNLVSGDLAPRTDAHYATKEDFESFKNDILEMLTSTKGGK